MSKHPALPYQIKVWSRPNTANGERIAAFATFLDAIKYAQWFSENARQCNVFVMSNGVARASYLNGELMREGE